MQRVSTPRFARSYPQLCRNTVWLRYWNRNFAFL